MAILVLSSVFIIFNILYKHFYIIHYNKRRLIINMEILKGEVGPILYSGDNEYKVFILNIDLSQSITCHKKKIKVNGQCNVMQGDDIEVGGEFTQSEKYGEGFRLMFVRHEIPSDVAHYVTYLMRQVNGVGPVTARTIVGAFGDKTFDVIRNEPEKLARLPKISMTKAQDISDQISQLTVSQEEQMLYAKLNISQSLSMKIKKQYKQDTEKVLTQNPYQMIGVVEHVGFKKADDIGIRAGIARLSPFRIQSGISHTIKSQCDKEGHSFIYFNDVLCSVSKELCINRNLIANELKNMDKDGKIKIDKDKVYLSQYYNLEKSVAKKIVSLSCFLGGKNVEDKILQIESDKGIKLDDVQRGAVAKAVENGLSIITGGPGTGKTTVLDTLITYLSVYEGSEFSIAAPTGKAAKRIKEQTGKEATTIHRLVGSVANIEETQNGIIVSSSDNKDGFISSDTVIIDEMSMVSLPLMKMLLDVIIKGTRVVLVGDVDQLPSIGVGQILRDLIECGYIPVTKLVNIYRQAADSHIILNAHAINQGRDIALNNKYQDFFFVQRKEKERTVNDIKMLISTFIPNEFGIDPFDIQVLCPRRKHDLGVYEMNSILQDFLNPAESSKNEVRTREAIFREGDKVIHIKNDYDIEWEDVNEKGERESGAGIFNGEVGIIQSIDCLEKQLTVLYDDTKLAIYDFQLLNELELAYAMTIHKSQGSEYGAVIIPLLTGGDKTMYNKALIYTGITRAKKCVGILGDRSVVQNMIKNNISAKRNTSLKERCKENFIHS